MKLAVTISGSFQRALEEIRDDIGFFEGSGCQVLSPRMFKKHKNEDGFVVLDSDGGRRPAAIHGRHLSSIERSAILWVRNPGGYLGLSTALEIGYAHSLGVAIYASDRPEDTSLARYVKVVGSPEAALEAYLKNAGNRTVAETGAYDPQSDVAYMSVECGFDQETDEEIVRLLDGEVSELKEALNAGRLDPNQRHSVPEELADCAIYLYHFANQSGINLSRAIKDKVKIDLQRWGKKRGTG